MRYAEPDLDPQQKEFPPSLLERMGELGYFGVTIPTEYGGMGLGVFECCLPALLILGVGAWPPAKAFAAATLEPAEPIPGTSGTMPAPGWLLPPERLASMPSMVRTRTPVTSRVDAATARVFQVTLGRQAQIDARTA